MRFERGGKGKYWIPKPGDTNSRTPLLGGNDGTSRSQSPAKRTANSDDVANYGGAVGDDTLDADDERLYVRAKALEYGDWNVSLNPCSTYHLLTPTVSSHNCSRSIKGNVAKCIAQLVDNINEQESSTANPR